MKKLVLMLVIALAVPAIGFSNVSFEVENNKVYKIDRYIKTIKVPIPKKIWELNLEGLDTVELDRYYSKVLDSFSTEGLEKAKINLNEILYSDYQKIFDNPNRKMVFRIVTIDSISDFFLKI